MPAKGDITLRRRLARAGFGLRLFLALALALALVGFAAYRVISARLTTQQLDNYLQTQEADAKTFEAIGRKIPRMRVVVREIDEQLDGLGRRPGTIEALLIGPGSVILASNIERLNGIRDSDSRIAAALHRGVASAGHEADPSRNSSNFEFVSPVNLKGGRYVLETSYSAGTLDSQQAGVREALLLVIAIAVVGVAGLFYLFGGRTLLRHHRLALERATRDGLTDLPNHRAFEDELAQAMASAARSRVPLALALIDVDNFKLTNDRHGHPQGDAVLRQIATTLRDGRTADRAFRIGGDEFALLMPGTDDQGAAILVERLARALREAATPVSVGVATVRAGHPQEDLRGEADAALYEAKRRGGACAVSFEEIRDRVSVTTTDKREAVRAMIAEERLSTVFQPIWNFESGDLLGIEALTRPDSRYGLSGPSEAFDIAEQIGSVHDLDELCATRALLAVREPPEGALLFVNLAPKTLELDAGASDWLLGAVEAAGLDPDQVVVEVTERIGSRMTPVLDSLHRLREQGFKLALDDVGTGNAGLEMLREVGADFVKLDQSIVAAAATEPNARAVLMAMATFARQADSFVIAEGIEDEETLAFLRSVEAIEVAPGAIIQGGQGFQLGVPAARIPSSRALLAVTQDT